MNFTEAVSKVYRNYVTFAGRARQSEYWWFILFWFVAGLLVLMVEYSLGMGTLTISSSGDETFYNFEGDIFSLMWWLFNLLPGLAVAVRRLHDTDRSGVWFLLIFIPILGWIALFVFLVSAGTRGPNRFGEDPIR